MTFKHFPFALQWSDHKNDPTWATQIKIPRYTYVLYELMTLSALVPTKRMSRHFDLGEPRSDQFGDLTI